MAGMFQYCAGLNILDNDSCKSDNKQFFYCA